MTTRRPSQMDVARAIRHVLAATGATPARVARGAGLSTSYLGALTRGERIPSLPTLLAAARERVSTDVGDERRPTITDRSVMATGGAPASPTATPRRPS